MKEAVFKLRVDNIDVVIRDADQLNAVMKQLKKEIENRALRGEPIKDLQKELGKATNFQKGLRDETRKVADQVKKGGDESIGTYRELNKNIKDTESQIRDLVAAGQGESDQANKLRQEYNNLVAEKKNVDRETKKMIQDANAQGSAYDQLRNRVSQLQRELRDLEAAGKGNSDEAQRLRNEFRQSKSELDEVGRSTRAAGSEYREFSARLNSARESLKDLLALQAQGKPLTDEQKQSIVTLTGQVQEYDRQLKEIDGTVGQFQRNVGNYQSAFEGVGRSLTQAFGIGFLVGGVAQLTSGVVRLGQRTVQLANIQEQAVAKVEQLVKQTGMTAGFTSDQLQKMAKDLQENTLFGDEEILEKVTAQLLTFRNIGGDAFERTQRAALDLATVLDKDVRSISIQLGRALNDPIQGMTALTRSGVAFTTEQRQLVRELVETNQLAEAQALILKELEDQYGGTAQAAAEAGLGPLQQLRNAWNDNLELVGSLIISFNNALLPAMRLIVGATEAVLTVITSLSEWFGENRVVLYGLVTALLAFNAQMIISNTLTLASTAAAKAKAAQDLILNRMLGLQTTSWRGLNAAMMANPIGLIVGGIALLITGLVTLYQRSEAFRDAVNDLGATLKNAFSPIIEFVSDLWERYGFVVKNAGEIITRSLRGLFNVAVEVFKILGEGLGSFVNAFNKILQRDFRGAVREIGNGIRKTNPIGIALTEGKRLGDSFVDGFRVAPKQVDELMGDVADGVDKSAQEIDTSIEGMQKRLSDLREEFNKLSAEERNSDYGRNLINRIRQTEAEISKATAALQRNQKQVKEAEIIPVGSMAQAEQQLRELESGLNKMVVGSEEWLQRQDEINEAREVLNDLTEKQKQLLGEIEEIEVELIPEGSIAQARLAVRELEEGLEDLVAGSEEYRERKRDILIAQEELNRRLNEAAEIEKEIARELDPVKAKLEDIAGIDLVFGEDMGGVDEGLSRLTELISEVEGLDIYTEEQKALQLSLLEEFNDEYIKLTEQRLALVHAEQQEVRDQTDETIREVADRLNMIQGLDLFGSQKDQFVSFSLFVGEQLTDLTNNFRDSAEIWNELFRGSIDQLSQMAIGFAQERAAKQMQAAEQAHRRELDLLNNEIAIRRELLGDDAEAQEALEEERVERELQLEKEAAEERRNIARKEAFIKGALAIVNALATVSNPILQAIQIGFIAATTAAQIAEINKQSFFDGGFTNKNKTIGRDSHGQIKGYVHDNEYVAPKHQVRRYPALFRALDMDRARKNTTGVFRPMFDGGFASNAPMALSSVRVSNVGELSSAIGQEVGRSVSQSIAQSIPGAFKAAVKDLNNEERKRKSLNEKLSV